MLLGLFILPLGTYTATTTPSFALGICSAVPWCQTTLSDCTVDQCLDEFCPKYGGTGECSVCATKCKCGDRYCRHDPIGPFSYTFGACYYKCVGDLFKKWKVRECASKCKRNDQCCFTKCAVCKDCFNVCKEKPGIISRQYAEFSDCYVDQYFLRADTCLSRGGSGICDGCTSKWCKKTLCGAKNATELVQPKYANYFNCLSNAYVSAAVVFTNVSVLGKLPASKVPELKRCLSSHYRKRVVGSNRLLSTRFHAEKDSLDIMDISTDCWLAII